MDNDYIEQDDEPKKPTGRACYGDMTGMCPGRANCPACQDDDANEDHLKGE